MEFKMINGEMGDNTPQLQRGVRHYSLDTTWSSFLNLEIFIGKEIIP
jgi:hypothetical protein